MNEAQNLMNHINNMALVNKANSLLNDFIDDGYCKLYFYDDNGEVFIPKGKIRIVPVVPVLTEE